MSFNNCRTQETAWEFLSESYFLISCLSSTTAQAVGNALRGALPSNNNEARNTASAQYNKTCFERRALELIEPLMSCIVEDN